VARLGRQRIRQVDRVSSSASGKAALFLLDEQHDVRISGGLCELPACSPDAARLASVTSRQQDSAAFGLTTTSRPRRSPQVTRPSASPAHDLELATAALRSDGRYSIA